MPAEGEGRNAVWAAIRGWTVHTLEKCDVELDEGRYHLGVASVVRMRATA